MRAFCTRHLTNGWLGSDFLVARRSQRLIVVLAEVLHVVGPVAPEHLGDLLLQVIAGRDANKEPARRELLGIALALFWLVAEYELGEPGKPCPQTALVVGG